MTFLILDSSKKIHKDILYWDDLVKDSWRHKPLLNSVYDIENHGVSCKCCSSIIKESTTCPTKAERKVKPRRGRPNTKKGRGGGSEK